MMLEFEEFSYANIQLGQPGRLRVNERAFRASAGRQPLQGIKFRDGRIFWCWTRHGLNEDEIIGSNDFWCFRIPLSTESEEWGWINLYRAVDSNPLLLDMNYLFGLLRTDLAAAASRILRSFSEHMNSSDSTPRPATLTMTVRENAG
jgi:hypothetical protein